MNESRPRGPDYNAVVREEASKKRLDAMRPQVDEKIREAQGKTSERKASKNIAENRSQFVDDGLEAKLRAADELVARRNADIQRQIKDSQARA